MKNFLASIILATTVLTPVLNQTISTDTQDKYSETEFYWRSDRKDVLIDSTYTKNVTFNNYFIYTVFIGNVNIKNFSTATIIDPHGASYTKTSWGNDAYWGKKPSSIVKEIRDFDNKKIVTNQDVAVHARIAYLHVNATDGLASLESVHSIGFSYYSENGSNYVQIFGRQSAVTIQSYSGGAMWTNIGQGIKFNR